MPKPKHQNKKKNQDTKFETDPYDVDLRGLMDPDRYEDAIEAVNRTLEAVPIPARSTGCCWRRVRSRFR